MNKLTFIEVMATFYEAGITTTSQKLILFSISKKPGIKAQPIADILKCHYQSVHNVAKVLEKKGYVRAVREKLPNNYPSKKYYLTKEGEELIKKVEKCYE